MDVLDKGITCIRDLYADLWRMFLLWHYEIYTPRLRLPRLAPSCGGVLGALRYFRRILRMNTGMPCSRTKDLSKGVSSEETKDRRRRSKSVAQAFVKLPYKLLYERNQYSCFRYLSPLFGSKENRKRIRLTITKRIALTLLTGCCLFLNQIRTLKAECHLNDFQNRREN